MLGTALPVRVHQRALDLGADLSDYVDIISAQLVESAGRRREVLLNGVKKAGNLLGNRLLTLAGGVDGKGQSPTEARRVSSVSGESQFVTS